MKYCHLNGEKLKDRDILYDVLKKELELPDHFGDNLDALWDALGDMRNTKIVIDNARILPRALGEYGLMLLDTFGDADSLKGVEVVINW